MNESNTWKTKDGIDFLRVDPKTTATMKRLSKCESGWSEMLNAGAKPMQDLMAKASQHIGILPIGWL